MDSEGRQGEGLATSIVRHDGEVEDGGDDDSSALRDIRGWTTEDGKLFEKQTDDDNDFWMRSDGCGMVWYGMV